MLPIMAKPVEGQQQNASVLHQKYRKSGCCISHRQWTILYSILIFIITAIVTTCIVLGTLHTRQLLELLDDDIQEERERHRYEYGNVPGISSNEARLRGSRDEVLTFSKILSICVWLGWLNLIMAAMLIYGVMTMTSVYIIPWILLSGTTYLLAVTTVIMDCVDLLPHLYISHTILWIFVAVSIVFVHMWYTIVLYYVSLSRTACSMTVIHAYGGYIHTIQPVLANSQKPPLV